jgi:hypothetical protein
LDRLTSHYFFPTRYLLGCYLVLIIMLHVTTKHFTESFRHVVFGLSTSLVLHIWSADNFDWTGQSIIRILLLSKPANCETRLTSYETWLWIS